MRNEPFWGSFVTSRKLLYNGSYKDTLFVKNKTSLILTGHRTTDVTLEDTPVSWSHQVPEEIASSRRASILDLTDDLTIEIRCNQPIYLVSR